MLGCKLYFSYTIINFVTITEIERVFVVDCHLNKEKKYQNIKMYYDLKSGTALKNGNE